MRRVYVASVYINVSVTHECRNNVHKKVQTLPEPVCNNKRMVNGNLSMPRCTCMFAAKLLTRSIILVHLQFVSLYEVGNLETRFCVGVYIFWLRI